LAKEKKWQPLVGCIEDHLSGSIGSVPEDQADEFDPKHREKVDRAKVAVEKLLADIVAAADAADPEKLRMHHLALLLKQSKDEKKAAEAAKKAAQVDIDARNEILMLMLREHGMSGFDLVGGGKCFTEIVPHTSIVDQATLREWALRPEQGSGELLSVGWSRLNALNKARIEVAMEEGTSLEDAIVPGSEVRVKTTVKFTKG
jgi:hypothetical protein